MTSASRSILPCLDLLHHRGPGEQLRHRARPEHGGLGIDRRVLGRRRNSRSPSRADLAVLDDDDHRAGDVAALERIGHEAVEPGLGVLRRRAERPPARRRGRGGRRRAGRACTPRSEQQGSQEPRPRPTPFASCPPSPAPPARRRSRSRAASYYLFRRIMILIRKLSNDRPSLRRRCGATGHRRLQIMSLNLSFQRSRGRRGRRFRQGSLS